MQFLKHSAAVSALAFSPDGTTLAIGGRDGSVVLHKVEGIPIGELANTPILALAFDPGGTRVYLAGPGGWFGCERRADGQWNFQVPKESVPATSLAFLDDDVLAIGIGDRMKPMPGLLELRNVTSSRRLEPHFREPTGVRSLATHPASRTVAWTSAGKRLSVWPTQMLEPRTLGLAHAVPALAFHPDGERLAVAQEWSIAIFDPRTLDNMRTLKGHTGRVTAVAFSPDGRRMASASWDQTVRYWDLDHGTPRATFDWGIGRVTCLVFAPDGLRLAAGGESGTIVIVDVE
ncbi:MAG: hypothetical protein JNK93_11255 [Planctomycetia bacterium]|nr:hypothetical protein [Planctomycetia bacterium]